MHLYLAIYPISLTQGLFEVVDEQQDQCLFEGSYDQCVDFIKDVVEGK